MIVGMGAELDGETVNDGRRNGAAGPCNNTSRIRQVKTLQARCMGRCINA